jgi:hypothetical protein
VDVDHELPEPLPPAKYQVTGTGIFRFKPLFPEPNPGQKVNLKEMRKTLLQHL